MFCLCFDPKGTGIKTIDTEQQNQLDKAWYQKISGAIHIAKDILF